MQIYIVFTQLCYIMMQKEWHFNFKKGVLKHADFASMAEISFPKTWEDAPGKPPTGGQLKVAAFHRTPSAKNLDPPQILLAVRSLSKGSSISTNRGFARQPCCMAGTMKLFCIRKKNFSHRKKNLLFLPCNMSAVQNLYSLGQPFPEYIYF